MAKKPQTPAPKNAAASNSKPPSKTIAASLNEGLNFHQNGEFQKAKECYEGVLKSQPRNFDGLRFLATLFLQAGHYLEAIELFNKAALIKKTDASIFSNKGNALKELGRFDEALESYNKSLVLKPKFAEAFSNRGITLQELHRLDEALASFDQAIQLKPEFAEAHSNKALVLHKLKRFEETLISCDKAIALKPDYVEAHSNRGIALQELNRLDEALQNFDHAIALNPNYAVAHFNRGFVLNELRRFHEAVESYDKALALNPTYAEAYFNRAIPLNELNRFDEALESCDRAIQLKPSFAEAYCNRGIALKDQKRFEEALQSFNKAIELAPQFAEAYSNRGLALKELRHIDAAINSYDQAIALKPEVAEFYFNKATALILTGQYLEGWEIFEWRVKGKNVGDIYSRHNKHPWRGQENIQGKKLLIHHEHGLGDTIQFCRYVPLAEALGAEITLEVPENLVSLISTLKPQINVVAQGTSLPEMDACCPIMSLPHVFKTTVETIPSPTPYLFSDKTKVAAWKQKLGQSKKLRVGLVWSGDIVHRNDHNRSIRLQEMVSLTDLPLEWHSLQKEYRSYDLDVIHQHQEIKQHQDDIVDFSDTAALVECMDLVISVDTSIAHAAGAIGKPVWILMPFTPDYRWMLDRKDCPWYATAELFRQNPNRQWADVLQNVKAELSQRFIT